MLYVQFEGNTFMQDYSQQAITEIRRSGESPEVIANKIEELQSNIELYSHPAFQIIITFSEIVPLGVAVTLFSAFLLKSNEKA
jgi:hypothetical protein